MPKGVCDPSPDPYNTLYLGVANDQVTLEAHWTWDGVSVYPDCDGPVISVRVRNVSETTFTATLPNARRAGGRTYPLPPGTDITLNAPGTLKNLGWETIQDLGDMNVTVTPV